MSDNPEVMGDIIAKIPPVDAEKPFTKEDQDTILNAKLDYEALSDEAKQTIRPEDAQRLNSALANLPGVTLAVEQKTDPSASVGVSVSPDDMTMFMNSVDADDFKQLKDGSVQTIKVVMQVEELSALAEEEQERFDEACGSYKAGQHVSVDVAKQLYADKESTHLVGEKPITTLSNAISLVFTIPDTLAPEEGTTRVFKMVRTHKDTGAWSAVLLDDTDDNKETFTVQTDQFSSFSLVYTDTHTVLFDTGEGSPVSGREVAGNNAVPKPSDPTRKGYTFGGWYTDAECTKAWDFDTVMREAVTLFAKWEKKQGEIEPPIPEEPDKPDESGDKPQEPDDNTQEPEGPSEKPGEGLPGEAPVDTNEAGNTAAKVAKSLVATGDTLLASTVLLGGSVLAVACLLGALWARKARRP